MPARFVVVSALIGAACTGALLVGCSSGPSSPAGFDPMSFPAYGSLNAPKLYEGLAPYSRPVTTDSEEAQRYFDQGLNWLYAFNHDEAVQSFTRATELDPGCAMAWWGIGYTQGPNYNDAMMTPARSAAAWSAAQEAVAQLDDETPVERALVEALALRYEEMGSMDRRHLDVAFADAMGAVREAYPSDPDVGTMYAESLMVQYPWKLYTIEGEPAREQTNDLVRVIEGVMAASPQHPGANHLYIHAIEPSNDKERAIVAADRLSDMAPASGHLLHMPSHIYVQVGMWDRAVEQSHKAMASDTEYRVVAPMQMIQHGYMSHNAHMLAFAAMMSGRENEAMAAARSVRDDLPAELLPAIAPFVDVTMCVVYDVHKRFGRWDELLAEPAPPEFLPITTAVWHAHRAIAYAAKKDFENAGVEHRAFREAMKALPEDMMFGYSTKFLLISDFFVSGEMALQQGDFVTAAAMLEEAVLIEDTLGYGEPPLWLQPARHTLGVVYLSDDQPEQAERVYRADLERWPNNGWSLLGLAQALEAQGRDGEALEARAAFDRVWAGADEELTTSCKCVGMLSEGASEE